MRYRMLILGILIFSCMNILRKATEWSRIGGADGDPMNNAFARGVLNKTTSLPTQALGAMGTVTHKTSQLGIGAARLGAVGALKGGGALAGAGGKAASVMSRPVRRQVGKAAGRLAEKGEELQNKLKDQYGSSRYAEQLGDFKTRQELRLEDKAKDAADSFDSGRI